MVKGKAKSSEDLPPPQTRSLRSRKREPLSDESSLADDVQTTVQQKSTEEEDTAARPLQYPLLDCVVLINQHHQAAEPSCIPQKEDLTKEKHETTNVTVTYVAVTRQEETIITNSKKDSELESCEIHTDNVTIKTGENEEETSSESFNKSPNQNSTNQLQVCLPISKDDEESAALEKQMFEKLNSNLEKHQDKSSVCICVKESPAGFPAKKKRRMGLFGLTEKERSQFLQTQKHENGQSGNKSQEKQICDQTAGSVALDENVSLPSSHCGQDHQAGSEVHIAGTASDETSTVCDTGSSGGEGCEADEGPELTDNPQSHQHKEEEEEKKCLDAQKLMAENVIEMPQNQMKENEDESVNLGSAFTPDTNQTEESDKKDTTEAAVPQINTEEKTVEMVEDGTGEGAASADDHSGGLNFGSVKLYEASLTPSVPEPKYSCDPEDAPHAGPSAQHTQTRDTNDPFGSGYVDYVSDSQLNTIVLVDEEMMEEEEEPDSISCHEDATELICGLIKELSSLNRKVMVAHRELDNLRRRHPRSSIR